MGLLFERNVSTEIARKEMYIYDINPKRTPQMV